MSPVNVPDANAHAIPSSRAEAVALIGKVIHNLVNIRDETGQFLLRLEDGRVIDTKGWAGWEWTHGVGLYGILKHWMLNGDPGALKIMQDWFDARFAEGQTSKNVNTVAPFLTAAYLVEKAGGCSFDAWMDEWAEWVMSGMPRTEEGGLQHIVYNSVNEQQIWDDTLMMSVMPLAKIGLLRGRPHYVEEAKRQFMLHIKYLTDRQTGLWFHGWTFKGRHHFANALWARGNSWVTIAIPEFIELLDLPPHDGLRIFLIDALEAQVKALAQHQHASGLWRTIIPDETSYLEASATAGFAYGVMKGVRLGYLSPVYEDMAIRAIEGVIRNINADGELLNVSFGTPVFDTIQGYKDIALTSMPYGQAMAILALAEYMNRFE